MLSTILKNLANLTITITLWFYYIAGFIYFYSFLYLRAFFFSSKREDSFQKLNYRLHLRFFSLMRIIIPRAQWKISEDVSSIRYSIIIANHLSFLDPILFVSLFEKQKTIVKHKYFSFPVFGWILNQSGYVPSTTDGLFTESMMHQLKYLKDYLAGGGNLFIFPEGTRSLDGELHPFDKGAFRIARLCGAPIKVVSIKDTNKLYPPGAFLFNTRDDMIVEIKLAGSIHPDYESADFSLSRLMIETRDVLKRKVD
jgi:1-acyl-sn-glycerol-3-phosphate acyltransferase